ncbi:MAG: transglycosylase SLT domain-containing protein [Lautropia sp.]|nr:transglycosylase SLT domain-containing protein [Lautropia sp.]
MRAPDHPAGKAKPPSPSRSGRMRLLARASLLLGSGWLAACASVPPPQANLARELSSDTYQPGRVSDSAITQSDAVRVLDTASLSDDDASVVVSDDLWGRIRAGFALPELDSPLVAEKERYYLSRPDYLQRMFARGSRYLHHIVEEIEKRGMPTELALLPFVESAMNPTAMSSAKASGLWQFIPSTGKHYDLKQNWWVDKRRDVVESTRAALDYLQRIHELNENDWFLALASYNWGEGSVRRAVKANRAAGRPADYAHLRMPTETRHYVPKLLAIKHIIQHADRLGLQLPDLPDQPYFVTVEKTRPIDLKLAARFAGMTEAEFLALNPAHNRPVISASRSNTLKIPVDRIEQFKAAMAEHAAQKRPFVSWQPHTMLPGEQLSSLAAIGGMTSAELLRVNGISSSARLLPGTRLLVPTQRVSDESLVEQFNGPRLYQRVESGPMVHRVRRGETATSIARRYGVSVAQLRALNRRVSPLKPGMRLVVRRSQQQTLLVAEDGSRQLLRATPKVASAEQNLSDVRTRSGLRLIRSTPSRSASARSATRVSSRKVSSSIRSTRSSVQHKLPRKARTTASASKSKGVIKRSASRKTVASSKRSTVKQASSRRASQKVNRPVSRTSRKVASAR